METLRPVTEMDRSEIQQFVSDHWRSRTRPLTDDERQTRDSVWKLCVGGHAGGLIISSTFLSRYLPIPVDTLDSRPSELGVLITLFIAGLVFCGLALMRKDTLIRETRQRPSKEEVELARKVFEEPSSFGAKSGSPEAARLFQTANRTRYLEMYWGVHLAKKEPLEGHFLFASTLLLGFGVVFGVMSVWLVTGLAWWV